jgi:hypothetical protein
MPRRMNTRFNYVTNFLELRRSREEVSCAATQELASILWNSKVHHHFHNSQLILILSKTELAHTKLL